MGLYRQIGLKQVIRAPRLRCCVRAIALSTEIDGAPGLQADSCKRPVRSPPGTILRLNQRSEHNILKHSRPVQRSTACIASNLGQPLLQRLIAGQHLRDRRHIPRLVKDIPQPDHQIFRLSPVYLGVDPIHIARRALRLIFLPVEDMHLMRLPASPGVIERQPQFQRHIESRNAPRQLRPRKIMDGKARFLNQPQNRFQPPFIRNGKRHLYLQSKLGKTNNIR